MGNRLDWSAIELVAELIGIEDIETLVADLLTLREHLSHG